MNLKKALLLSLLVGEIIVSGIQADAPTYASISPELYDQLETMDQSVGYFKSTNKYPYYWVYNPATNCLKQVLCGSYNKEINGNVEIKNPEQLSSISPLRFSVMSIDQGTFEDVRYEGYRDTLFGQIIEKLLKTIKIIPDRHFKGRLFVDEYQQALPQKWVFGNAKEFGFLRKYIQANFNLHAVKPLAIKPILVLEIMKDLNKLTKQDVSFLKKYFTLADPKDKKIASFFKKNEKFALKGMSILGKGIPIKLTLGEKQFGKIEKAYEKFSLEEACAVGTLSVLGYVYKDHITSWIMSLFDTGTKKKDTSSTQPNPVRSTPGSDVVAPSTDAQKTGKSLFQEIKENSKLIISGTVGALLIAAIINYWYQSVHEKAEELPSVTYGDEIDDNDIETACSEEVIDEVAEIDELEEQLAAEFIANR